MYSIQTFRFASFTMIAIFDAKTKKYAPFTWNGEKELREIAKEGLKDLREGILTNDDMIWWDENEVLNHMTNIAKWRA